MKQVTMLLIFCSLVSLLALVAHADSSTDNEVLVPDWGQLVDPFAYSQVLEPDWSKDSTTSETPFCQSVQQVLANGVEKMALIGEWHKQKRGERFSLSEGRVSLPGMRECSVFVWNDTRYNPADYRCTVSRDNCALVENTVNRLAQELQRCFPKWHAFKWSDPWNARRAHGVRLLMQGRLKQTDTAVRKIFLTLLRPSSPSEVTCSAQLSIR